MYVLMYMHTPVFQLMSHIASCLPIVNLTTPSNEVSANEGTSCYREITILVSSSHIFFRKTAA